MIAILLWYVSRILVRVGEVIEGHEAIPISSESCVLKSSGGDGGTPSLKTPRLSAKYSLTFTNVLKRLLTFIELKVILEKLG